MVKGHQCSIVCYGSCSPIVDMVIPLGGLKDDRRRFNRPFLHKDFGCPEACLMAAPSGCSVFQLYLNSRK